MYRRLKEYLMTEEQLKENGYPMPHPEKPGRAVLFTAEEKKTIDCKLCWLLRSARFARYITAGDARPACKRSFCIKRFLVAAQSCFLLLQWVSLAVTSVSAGQPVAGESSVAAGSCCFLRG